MLARNARVQSRRFTTSGTTLSDAVLFNRDPVRGIGVVTINRPKAFNALNRDVVANLQHIFAEVRGPTA